MHRRKVILNLAVSLDGFIEGPSGEFDWCFSDQDYGMKAFMKSIDTIFMGRKSYEVALKYEGKNPYPKITTYVFSKTLKEAGKGTRIVSGVLGDEVRKITAEKGKNIWLFGGASLVTGFLNEGLIDELQLAVHPIILGSGKPLFQGIKDRILFNLKRTKKYSSGLVQLFYTKQSHKKVS